MLKLVQEGMKKECIFWGYDVSPQALEFCRERANENLRFKLEDIRQEEGVYFDLILLMDVLEHLEDYFSFVIDLRPKSEYKIFHIPLDISVRTVFGNDLIRFRATYGHLHYFTKDVEIQMLRDLGYDVVSYMYTWEPGHSLEFVWNENKNNPRKLARGLLHYIAKQIVTVPSQILFAIHQDLTVRVLGGWRLLVLAK